MEVSNAPVKVVFSLHDQLLRKFKKHVPARKRSVVVENLITTYLAEEAGRAGWEATRSLRKMYSPSSDSIKLSAVDWIRDDRSKH